MLANKVLRIHGRKANYTTTTEKLKDTTAAPTHMTFSCDTFDIRNTVFNFALGVRPAEGEELVRQNPIEVSIFNFLCRKK